MSPHELQQKLLEYYTLHYKVVEGMEEDEIFSYLKSNYLHHGICHVIKNLYEQESADNSRWIWGITKSRGRALFWDATPCECYTKEQNLSALSTRIQILTELVKQ